MKTYTITELEYATGYTRQHLHRMIKSQNIQVEKLGERQIGIKEADALSLIKRANSEISELYLANSELAKLIEHFLEDYVTRIGNKLSDKDLISLYALTKTHKGILAVLVLSRSGLGEAANTIVRQIFETERSLRLILASHDTKHAKNFIASFVKQRRNIIGKAYGDPKFRVTIEKRRKSLDEKEVDIKLWKELEKSNPQKGYWHGFKSFEHLMKELNSTKFQLIDLQILNEYAHFNPVDLDRFIREEGGEIFLSVGPTNESVTMALVRCFNYSFQTLDLINEKKSVYPTNEFLKEHVVRYEALCKKYEDAASFAKEKKHAN